MTDPVSISMGAEDRLLRARNPIRLVAEKLEASFLSEMLKFGGLEPKADSFGASSGESQFASFHRDALAQEMVKAGGIGLADIFFQALRERANDV